MKFSKMTLFCILMLLLSKKPAEANLQKKHNIQKIQHIYDDLINMISQVQNIDQTRHVIGTLNRITRELSLFRVLGHVSTSVQ